MEPTARKRSDARPRSQNVPQFDTFASLITAFGEFKLLADSHGVIAGLWTQRKRRGRLSPGSFVGCPLRAVVQPHLLAEIDDLSRRTSTLNRRDEIECPVKTRGVQRWFSVCAIPVIWSRGASPLVCLVARDATHRVDTLQTLSEREALLEQAEQLANFGSWELDLKTSELTLSPRLRKMYELAPDQEWSADEFWRRIYPSDRARLRPFVEKSLLEGRSFEFVARYCAPNGNVRVYLAKSLSLHDKKGKPTKAIGVIQDITEQSESHQELRRLSLKTLNQQDHERRHLARELHESAGQSLAALKMTLGRVRESLLENSDLALSLLESAALLADGAAREVRTVSYLLHPPMLDDAGIGPALRWYVKGLAERSKIAVTLEADEPFPRFSQEIETTVFRIVQEALTNVHRYSGSASASIRLEYRGSQLRIEIRDRGCGLPPQADPAHRRTGTGVGISGMRERVEHLDGTFELKGVPGEGTVVRVLLPTAQSKARRVSTPAIELPRADAIAEEG
jgi:signal transduction histidine kinase